MMIKYTGTVIIQNGPDKFTIIDKRIKTAINIKIK